MAAPTAPVRGDLGKLYRNTGTYGSPTWSEVSNVDDVNFPLELSDQDVTKRNGGGFKQHEPGLADIAATLKMLHDPADTAMAAFITAAWNRTSIELYILDQAYSTAGSQGIRATFKFFKQSRTEPVDGYMMQEFDVKPCLASNAPAYVTTV